VQGAFFKMCACAKKTLQIPISSGKINVTIIVVNAICLALTKISNVPAA
jgi:hypothetical protein